MSANNEEDMSPAASPGEVGKKAGIRRVNNLPVYIVGGLMTVFLVVMAMVAADRAAKQNQRPEGKDAKVVSASMFAKEIAGDGKEGLIHPQKKDAIPIARPDSDAPPAPPQSQPPPSVSRDGEDLNRIRMAKMRQLEEAIKAKTSVNATMARSVNSGGTGYSGAPTTRDEQLARLGAVRQQFEANTRDDPTAAYKARLAQVQGSGQVPAFGAGSSPGSGTAGPGVGSGSSAALQLMQKQGASTTNSVAQFGNTGQGDRWRLESQPEAPRTPYELRAGFVVPATLISGINSELPGQIIGQVAQNVYDTPTGKYLLIPQGARLVGAYSSDVAYGQARVLVAWQRIVFPDGKAMDIGAMPGTDSAGYAGFNDQVNNHYFRLFASAFLMSGITAGIAYSQNQNHHDRDREQSFSGAISEALGQQLGQVTAQLIAKNMNIAPTLEIRPAFRFNVMVTKDMTFSKPYEAFDY